MDHNTHGRLIVIDGLDGSGKSTQFDRLLGILSTLPTDMPATSFAGRKII